MDENEENGDRSPEVVLGFPCQRWVMWLAEVLGGGPEGSMKQDRPEEKGGKAEKKMKMVTGHQEWAEREKWIPREKGYQIIALVGLG